MAGIQYRRFTQEDKSQVLTLFHACFGKAREQAQWQWEFMDGPQGSIIIVAESESTIVGHYAVLPRTLLHRGSLVKAGLVVDVMTHPEYGRRGIFVESAQEAFKAAYESGISTLLGFPNKAAIRGHRKVHWAEVGEIRVLVRPLNANGLLKPFSGLTRLPKWARSVFENSFRVLARVTLENGNKRFNVIPMSVSALLKQEGLEEFIAESLPGSGISNARSIDWLRWRLSDPTGAYHAFLLWDDEFDRVLGFLILKTTEYKGLKTGAIFDLLVRDGDDRLAKPLLCEAIKKAHAEGCEICLMLRSPAMRFSSATRVSLMLPAPKKLKLIIKPVGGSKLPDDFMRIGNWHVQLIDHDVI